MRRRRLWTISSLNWNRGAKSAPAESKQIVSPKEEAHNCDDAVFAEVIRDDEFIAMHAITKKKKIQSIRDDTHWLDFILDLDGQVFDIPFLTEPWRSDTEKAFLSPLGDYIY